jgi:hypothetical protein
MKAVRKSPRTELLDLIAKKNLVLREWKTTIEITMYMMQPRPSPISRKPYSDDNQD